MIQLEDIRLSHDSYDVLINAGFRTTEDVSTAKPEQLVNVDASVLIEFGERLKDFNGPVKKAAEIYQSDEIAALFHDIFQVTDVILATVKAYERIYGAPGKLDDGLCACGVERAECQKNFPCNKTE